MPAHYILFCIALSMVSLHCAVCQTKLFGARTDTKYRILGESLLIPSLPGNALQTLVESRGLQRDSTCILEAEPGKLDTKRREPGILFVSSLFKVTVTMWLYSRFSCQFDEIDEVIQKVQRRVDLINNMKRDRQRLSGRRAKTLTYKTI